jgi:hypothetical protein
MIVYQENHFTIFLTVQNYGFSTQNVLQSERKEGIRCFSKYI